MVDLGGYIIILMNDNGKIKLYGSSADNADNPEVGDEILEVNGRTLENATDAEVSQYIHQCIKSGTISLQVTRRTGNKMKELDGPNADRIRDAWVIALERGARERLQKLPALRKIQPRDIQAILHQQITDGSASTSTDETPKKDVTNSHITVTLAETGNRNVPAKLSNGTVPKGVAKEEEGSKERKDAFEKQRSYPEEANLLQPVPGGREGERRASSPFQNGRTEVLIGEPEGTPRSPRGSTSSATNDANLLIPPGDSDYPESIYKSRRRSASGVGDIHLQQSQLQENNNGVSRDNVKGGGGGVGVGGGVDSRDTRVDITTGPNEMWAPGSSPGHNRELPVDVPDSLLQQAYANKQVMSLMLNGNETTLSSSTSSSRNNRQFNSEDNDDNSVGKRSASDHENPDNNYHHRHHHRHHLHHHHHRPHNHQQQQQQQQQQHHHHHHHHYVHKNNEAYDEDNVDKSTILCRNMKKNVRSIMEEDKIGKDDVRKDSLDDIENSQLKSIVDDKESKEATNRARIIETSVPTSGNDTNEMFAMRVTNKIGEDGNRKNVTSVDEENNVDAVTSIDFDVVRPFSVNKEREETEKDESALEKAPIVSRNGVTAAAILLSKETSVDPDEDYPFAKEDYPTMLKTCSDDSASPRSSSGRSDSTAPMDASLSMTGKESPLYDARRIDLGSPCRSLVTDIKLAPLFGRGRETTSFDNPAYGLATDLHDLHQGLLMRSDEVNDLTRLIDEQHLVNARKSQQTNNNKNWTNNEQSGNRHIVKPEVAIMSESVRRKKKSLSRLDLERIKGRGNRDSEIGDVDSEGLLGAGSTDDLLTGQLTNLTITRSNRRKKGQQAQSSSGYSTLRSDASIGEFRDQPIFSKDRSFLVVGNRSYREVAVDCPADFVPVTKSHPVYPPPNKTDTIDRNSGCYTQPRDKRSSIIDRRSKTISGFCNDYGRHESTIGNNGSAKLNSKETIDDNDSTLPRNSRVKDIAINDFEDETPQDNQELVKSDDVRSVVSDLGGNRDGLREKVRSRLKSRVLHSGARLGAIGRNTTKTLLHSAYVDDFEKTRESTNKSAFYHAINNLQAFPNNFTTNRCKTSTSNDDKTRLDYCHENPTKYILFYENIGQRSHNDYVDDRIPRQGSVFDLAQRETAENSKNSFLEYIVRRNSTPVIVRYSTILHNEPIDKIVNINNSISSNDKTILFSSLDKNDGQDVTARLENAQNSFLSLEYHFNEIEIGNIGMNFKNRQILQKFPSDTNILQRLDNDSFDSLTRFFQSEINIGKKIGKNRFDKNSLKYRSIRNIHGCGTLLGGKITQLGGHFVNDRTDEHTMHKDTTNIGQTAAQAGLNGVKPAIPPRDQKRAPARPPKDNVILSSKNNNIEQTDNANTPEPTQQQLHSIRKYQEQLRKRKEEDERQEYLNSSVRSSRKLQALESHATTLPGQENLAYAQDELTSTPRSSHGTSGQTTPKENEAPPKVLTYGEVVATLERLQLQLRDLSGALGISGPGVEAELEAVRTLLVQTRFATALSTHHALKNRLRSGKTLKHHDDDASNLARDCVEVLEEWQTTTNVGGNETRAIVEELTGLLTSYEIEGLLWAHDSVISYVDGIQRKASSFSSSPSRSPSPSSSLRGTRNTENIKIIRIEKTNEPLGATVRNEGDAVIIGRVVRGGAADKSGLFHEGDEVLEVNGVEMRGKSVNEVCDILAGMQGGLTFLVLPASTNQRNNITNIRREENAQIHVRAHFDYDPEEDPYIPCRELGVSFQKGDVLHVISQEDSNWWQAYREGEEDHALAGLIPSRAFQHQRESMKQTIAGGKSTMRGSKKSSTLLCTRKNPKKKKKRTKFGPNFNDEGYPLYATTTIDDYDSEEVLTYEEVALYYPRANHKRPIVLIGPPNIGRHELRQRLMQDSERFAAAIPHTSRPRKGSEVDGQDYHFISRSQFESDILGRKFVEHGEYEKAYYGTSVEAIRTVVNSGKICVLNLHPQSLKILRSSDLKPYVVFVAPPSLEKLRQKRIKNNESFKEEELKDIIEKAREMEDKYGHLFDMIILNNDTDRAYNQLLGEINSLEREPQWVPASWVQ